MSPREDDHSRSVQVRPFAAGSAIASPTEEAEARSFDQAPFDRMLDWSARPGGDLIISGERAGPTRRLAGLVALRQARSAWSPSGLVLALQEERAHGLFFLLVPVLLACGIALWIGAAQNPVFWLGWLSLPLMGAAFHLRQKCAMRAAAACMAAGLILAGFGLAALEDARTTTVVLDSAVTTRIEGVVERREAAGEDRWRYTVRLRQTAHPHLLRPPTRITLLVRGQATPFDPGMIIAGRARLSPPSGPALPGMTDFTLAAYYDGIGATGFALGLPQRLRDRVGHPGGPDSGDDLHETWLQRAKIAVFDLRSRIGDRIRSLVPGDAGAFSAAIVTDERRAISPDTVEALRLAGLSHIVAISGLNMALAAGICFVGLRRLLALAPVIAQRWPIKKIAAGGALLLVTAYYLISGFGVSAERAYLMMAVMLLAIFVDRPSVSVHTVALSAILVMAIAPSALMGPSFQMSFAATGALVAVYTRAQRRRAPQMGRQPRRPGLLWLVATAGRFAWVLLLEAFMTSLIGGLSTTIYSAGHFHQITTYGLAANLASMPLISFVVMPAALIGMLAMPLGLDGPVFSLMGVAVDMVIAIATHVASWGGIAATGQPPALFLPLASLGLTCLVLLRTQLKLIGLPVLAAALALAGLARVMPPPDLLISEDGTLAAVLSDKEAMISRAHAPEFLYRQWQNAYRITTTRPAEEVTDNSRTSAAEARRDHRGGARPREKDKPSAKPRVKEVLTHDQLTSMKAQLSHWLQRSDGRHFSCLRGKACLIRTSDGVRIVLLEDARYVGSACDSADLVIARRSRMQACRSGAVLITGDHLRRLGAVTLKFGGSADRKAWSMTAAMPVETEQLRPWQIHRTYAWTTRSFDNHLPDHLRRLINGNGG
ncbi:ComEC/Rec2 family competence protein [Rhizobium sp. SSA_523]|uniref:ComEC/Rec2 family competence protein n=1 Tax=Rhizobium sp. SSA_523 TaxID=2952477 RepID=UPI002091950B|nr:ComEC/Rec2 family competence protein [Rhizobium sp. SSA_523]MCO5733909.1 ComEC family competence protein [Rhizobium sp. SSA_523]WKC24827.1 ComEC/Rec2 family competence protein [Rhizobium sp. SSA_523]